MSSLESFPDPITELMITCALRFDGYKYEEILGPTAYTGERLQDIFEKLVSTLSLHSDECVNFAAFFGLQRMLYKWGGEDFTKYSDYHIAYDFLFLHLYRLDVPSEFIFEEAYVKWRRIDEDEKEKAAAFVRQSFQRKGRGRICLRDPEL